MSLKYPVAVRVQDLEQTCECLQLIRAHDDAPPGRAQEALGAILKRVVCSHPEIREGSVTHVTVFLGGAVQHNNRITNYRYVQFPNVVHGLGRQAPRRYTHTPRHLRGFESVINSFVFYPQKRVQPFAESPV